MTTSLIKVTYSCGGTSTHREEISFDLDLASGQLSAWSLRSGAIDSATREFLKVDTRKIISEGEISDHLPGIRELLRTKYGIVKPIFGLEQRLPN